MQWKRWQGWVALVAGAYAALSPLWTATTTTATRTMVVLGVVTAAVALWSLAMPAHRISAYALVVMGALFMASPWVMGFDHIDDMTLTALIVGAVTLFSGVLSMPEVEERIHLHRPITH
jgi:SPW repeat